MDFAGNLLGEHDGRAAAAIGVPLPGVEWGISFSLVAFGLCIGVSRAAPLQLGAAVVALFAIFHGHAHAAEMSGGGWLPMYAAGFLTSTALLHLCGMVGGLLIARMMNDQAVRWAGGLVASAGILLVCGAI